jgi:hypothetical protein
VLYSYRMTEKRKPSARDIRERAVREELFTQVAVALIASRQCLPLKANSDNVLRLSDLFLEEASALTEGILKEAKTFGDK